MNLQQFLDYFRTALTEVNERIVQFIPQLLGALIYIGIGLLLARLVRFILARVIGNIDRIVPGRPIRARIRQFIDEKRIARIISEIVYWILIVFFVTSATETLGLPMVTTLLGDLAGYLPRILAAVTIVAVGLFAGAVVRDLLVTAVTSAEMPYGKLIGRSVQITITMLTLLLGIEQLGIDLTLITNLILLIVGAVLFSGALAFGIGAGASVSNILAAYYLQKIYSVGQMIRIDDRRGRIIEITSTAVILESADGRLVIPAKTFSMSAALIMTQEQNHE